MDAKTQIIVLVFSYFFGFLVYFLIILNNNIIKKKRLLYRGIITILLMYNITLIYIINLYKLNGGIGHVYFFLLMGLGVYSAYKLSILVKNSEKFGKLLVKVKAKCYTKEK